MKYTEKYVEKVIKERDKLKKDCKDYKSKADLWEQAYWELLEAVGGTWPG